MRILTDLINNKMLLAAMLGWFLAQTIKFVYYFLKNRKIDLQLLVAPGGMPSGHSACVTALTLSVGMSEGFGSAAFAISFVLSCIVMYDAAGIRRAAGHQAAAINKLLVEHPVAAPQEVLREVLGHTPIQVIAGALLGLGVGLLVWL